MVELRMTFQELIKSMKASGYSETDVQEALDLYIDILGGIK